MFSKLEGLIWMDGSFVPCEEANIHLVTHGFHYGTGVFEGIRSYDGIIFKALKHFDRLKKSANLLHFNIAQSCDEMIDITQTLLQKNNTPNAYIRPIAWCGTNSMKISSLEMDVHLAIAAWSWTEPVNKKMRLAVSSWRRPDPRSAPVQAKATGMYTLSSIAKSDAQLKGFDDALMLDCCDHIAESTVSNVFFVENDTLYTPIAASFLNGITRQTIIQIAKKIGINAVETTLKLSDLDSKTEAFLTGTAIEIQPIESIAHENNTWNFKTDTLTKIIKKEFEKMTRGDHS